LDGANLGTALACNRRCFENLSLEAKTYWQEYCCLPGEPQKQLYLFNALFRPSVQDKTHWQKGLGAEGELR
jgi:hypothetical protein